MFQGCSHVIPLEPRQEHSESLPAAPKYLAPAEDSKLWLALCEKPRVAKG